MIRSRDTLAKGEGAMRNILRRRAAARPLAVLMSMAALAAALPGAVHAENWNLSNSFGADSIHVQGNEVFAKALARLTNDEITVTVHSGGSLGYDSEDHFTAVADGAIELADTPGNFIGGADPFFLVSSLPFLAQTVDDARRLLDIARPEYEKIFAENGQILLYASPWPASGIWAKGPVTSAADLEGVKIRTFDPNGTRTFSAIGAAPIQLPWGDVVPQLATGGISAVLTSAEGGVTQNFVEFTPYFTEINYAVPLNFVHMNKDLFDGLSAERRQAVMDAAREAADRNWAELVNRTELNYAALRQAGGTVVTELSEDFLSELGAAGQAALDEWLEKTGERGNAAVAAFMAN